MEKGATHLLTLYIKVNEVWKTQAYVAVSITCYRYLETSYWHLPAIVGPVTLMQSERTANSQPWDPY